MKDGREDDDDNDDDDDDADIDELMIMIVTALRTRRIAISRVLLFKTKK